MTGPVHTQILEKMIRLERSILNKIIVLKVLDPNNKGGFNY